MNEKKTKKILVDSSGGRNCEKLKNNWQKEVLIETLYLQPCKENFWFLTILPGGFLRSESNDRKKNIKHLTACSQLPLTH